jgi:tetratricopeptide (TPR) repeat protein
MQEAVTRASTGHIEESDEMKTIPTRRELLGVGAEVGTAFALPAVLDADQVERLVWMVEQPSRLDMETLSDLEAITAHHWRLYVKASSKRDLLPGVVGHFQTIAGFLRSSLPTPIEQRLFSLASQQAQIVGEIYFDIHQFDQALSYLKVALQTAQRANNDSSYSVSLARVSLLFTYSNQPEEALPYLLAAHRPGTQPATMTTASWLAALEAEVHANQFRATIVRSSSRCLKALERAEGVVHQPKTGDDPYGTGFSPGNLAAFKGVCYLRLQQPENAQAVLHVALKQTPSLTEHRAAIILTDLAEAYVQQAEIEEACKHARQALEITLQTKSLHSLQRVEALRPQLERWTSTSYVQDVDDVLIMTRLRMM